MWYGKNTRGERRRGTKLAPKEDLSVKRAHSPQPTVLTLDCSQQDLVARKKPRRPVLTAAAGTILSLQRLIVQKAEGCPRTHCLNRWMPSILQLLPRVFDHHRLCLLEVLYDGLSH